MGDDLTITITKGTTPVLVTGEPAVVGAVLDTLERVLRGPGRAPLRLARELDGAPDGREADER